MYDRKMRRYYGRKHERREIKISRRLLLLYSLLIGWRQTA
jgi:hypothetical protein